MKFIDEVTIQVQAGKGGDGCCSFRREKFIPFGGPDGGDGGKGGDIYCKATSSLNTLIDLNYQKLYRSSKGRSGSGNLRSGKSGEDLIINVPIGTIIWDYDNKYVLGDLTTEGQTLLVAKGGKGGLGNHNFKSSTNRAPRKIIKGQLGEERILRLELRLLADVGLLGLPNSGKSTLINAGSAVNAKIANYPFSTLKPQLGVVKSSQGTFVMADLPGILAGAAKGVGLGIRFLKHLSRNKLLLHLVDLAHSLEDPGSYSDNNYIKQGNDISIKTSGSVVPSTLDYQRIIENLWTQIRIVENEIASYDDVNLSKIERWIVINKIDLLTATQLSSLQQLWQQQVDNIKYNVSAASAASNNINNTDDSLIEAAAAVNNLDNSAASAASNNINNLKVFWISAYNTQGVNSLLQNIIEHLTQNAVKQLKIC